MVLFRQGRQLRRGREREADKVEIRFKGSKRDQGRKGAVMVRTRNVRNERGGGVRRRRDSGSAGGAVRDIQRRGDARRSANVHPLEPSEMGGVDEGASGLLYEERIRGGEPDSRGLRAALGENRGGDQAGSGRYERCGGSDGRTVGVEGVHEISEGERGISDLGVRSPSKRERVVSPKGSVRAPGALG